jgi:hypothetical protein
VGVIIFSVLAIVTLAAAFDGYRRRRFGRNAVVVGTALAAIWLLDLLAISTHWKDADGFVDCNRSCSGFQDTVGVLFWFVPMAVLLLMLAALGAWLVKRRRHHSAQSQVRS